MYIIGLVLVLLSVLKLLLCTDALVSMHFGMCNSIHNKTCMISADLNIKNRISTSTLILVRVLAVV